MAAQYLNRQFFRKTPNFYLAKFFEAKGIQLDVNVNQKNIRNLLKLKPF